MFDLTHILTIVGLFTAVQFVSNSLKNWREAIRLVPIGNITPPMVSKYKTIPLCFKGSDKALASAITYTYGRLWIRPMARKQAALCDRIVFLDGDLVRQSRQAVMEAGMIVQATLSDSEFSPHIRRSARRCRLGSELVLAILFPTQDRQRYEPQVRCITVRSRARPAQDRPGRVPTRVIEWEVIDPAGIGARRDDALERHDVPDSCFWLVSQEEEGEDSPIRRRFSRVLYAYGSDWKLGSVTLVTTSVIKLSLIVLLSRMAEFTQFDQRISLGLLLISISLMLVFGYNLARYIVVQMSSELLITFAPSVHRTLSATGIWMSTLHHRLEWHGSTLRSLAVGNRIRRVMFWQQFHFVCWDPFVRWLRRYRLGCLGNWSPGSLQLEPGRIEHNPSSAHQVGRTSFRASMFGAPIGGSERENPPRQPS